MTQPTSATNVTSDFTIDGYFSASNHFQALYDIHRARCLPFHFLFLGDTVALLIGCAREIAGKLLRTQGGFSLFHGLDNQPDIDLVREKLAQIPHVRVLDAHPR